MKEVDGVQGGKWDLSDLYSGPEDPLIAEDLKNSSALTKEFSETYQGREVSALSPPEFLQALKKYEFLQEAGVKPFLYASLLFAENTRDTRYKTLMELAKEKWNELETQLLFFRLAIMRLPEEKLGSFLEYEPLRAYEHALQFLRRFLDFTRSENEEEIINRKNLTGRSAFTTLFDEFSGSFTFRLMVEGKEEELTGSEMLAMLYSPDRDLRERALRAFLQHYERNSLVFTSIFNALILDSRVEDEIRGYQTPMHRTHLENEISPETVELMMQVTENHYSLAREYFQLKACRLGLPKLKNTDLYAPYPGGRKKLSFQEAQLLLVDSFHHFYPRFGEIAQEFITKRWMDTEVRQGKYGGAFCSGLTPSLHPYLLINFTGHFRDALTLAHEMGHAIHFYLARKQTLLNFDPPLPLAETASVFGEMIMIHALLQKEQEVAVRQALLGAEIEDIIATVFRQNVLTRFEQEAHKRRRDHFLTGEEIAEMWWQANLRLFGESVEMIPEYRWGWSYISHFIHSRFYCYSYVFGELVVLSLFQRYQEEGDPFLPHLIRLLESGSSRSLDALLAQVGLDIHRAGFWEKGFTVIRGLIDELKSLGSRNEIGSGGDRS